MITLSIVMCLVGGEVCKTVSMPLTEAAYGLVEDPTMVVPGITNCRQRASLLVAEAMQSYPRWRVKEYTCLESQ